MKIELSKDEYRSLIEMLYIAEWIMNAHKIKKDPSVEQYARLEQKIYSFADQVGLHDLILHDEELGEYFPTKLMDEGSAMQHIDEYDNDTFWDELIERLVKRDVLRAIGADKLRKMTIEERWNAEDPLREKYSIDLSGKGRGSRTVMVDGEDIGI